MTADPTASHLVERLHQIAESQRMDHDSPHVGTTLEEVATLIEKQADLLAATEAKTAQAPHAPGCGFGTYFAIPMGDRRDNGGAIPCTCWKAEYEAAKEAQHD